MKKRKKTGRGRTYAGGTALRLTALLLCAVFSATALLACGEPGGKEQGQGGEDSGSLPAVTTGGGESAVTGDGDSGYVRDSLPDSLDFGGATVKVLYWDAENPEFFVEGETGTALNDTIWERNIAVQERLGVTFDFILCKGSYNYVNEYLTNVKNSVNGGTPYDILATYSMTAGTVAYNGLTADLMKQPWLDFEKPWWPDSLIEQSSINGQLHFASGDISTNVLYMMYAMYYNKDLAADLNIADPFSFVLSGEWTFDKMAELGQGVYADLDSDTKLSSGDRYAQSCYALHMEAFIWGAGLVGLKNDDGILEVDSDFIGEKGAALTDKVYEYLNSRDAAIVSDYKNIFRDGRSLFITDRADIAIFDLGERTFSMGILPIPKFSTDQEDYHTMTGNPFTLYEIPINAPDPAMSAAVIECQASEGYRRTTPAIFELSLKTRYADGGEAPLAYDLLRNGTVFDLSRIFAMVIKTGGASLTDLYKNQITDHKVSWSTQYKAYRKGIEKVVSDINAAFA